MSAPFGRRHRLWPLARAKGSQFEKVDTQTPPRSILLQVEPLGGPAR
jgi:hypothetical protein